ncbi:glycosyltransferase family 4 protein [uncultured Sphingomonas sp.]|uniref:glycosyltransferase family 4 protein n=1 Tax=uncultured Sphingomonas sp. TaxID=158754 RepID=UPI0025FD6132|nr:glycosyltransferase family 4 protein [uncultured Sphingomonas sp.]
MKIAVVHEWLTTYAGSEKVLAEILAEFPQADLFCLIDFLPDQDRDKLGGRHPKTTTLQRFPFIRSLYKHLLPLMPMAVEQHDLSGYDVIISNCHSVAKGVIVGPDQLHICYCYSPMRYAWDLQNQYLEESNLSRGLTGGMARWIFHRMRLWDTRTAFSVDHFIACSSYIARRIHKVYRRASTVIYPNVDVDAFVIGGERQDYYLTASRMVPYKKLHLIVEAFARMPDRKLVVIGTGPQFKRIKALATDNVSVLGFQEFAVLKRHLQQAKAFIFASEEDFGIAPLEAAACGTPVLAFERGGASETVIDGVTGLHFKEQTADAICAVVDTFEALPADTFDPQRIRAHAERFSTRRFRHDFGQFVRAAWTAHQQRLSAQKTQALFPAAPVATPDDGVFDGVDRLFPHAPAAAAPAFAHPLGEPAMQSVA